MSGPRDMMAQTLAQGVKALKPGAKAPAPQQLPVVPGAKPPLSLEPISPPGPQFDFEIRRGDQSLGFAQGRVKGNHAVVDWIGPDEANTLGPGGAAIGREHIGTLGARGLLELREAFRPHYPDVNTFTGFRVSGAKSKTNNNLQTIKIPTIGGATLMAPGAFDQIMGTMEGFQ